MTWLIRRWRRWRIRRLTARLAAYEAAGIDYSGRQWHSSKIRTVRQKIAWHPSCHTRRRERT